MFTLLILIVGLYKQIFSCGLNNTSVIKAANTFCANINVGGLNELKVLKTYNTGLLFGKTIKEVSVGKPGNIELLIDVDCGSGEVIRYDNYKVKHDLLNKKDIILNKANNSILSPVFTEDNARKHVFNYANTLKLTKGFILEKIYFDNKYSRSWVSNWLRTYNGYPYETDIISISIMDESGELYSYSKNISTEPMHTTLNVSKDDAVKIAKTKLINILGKSSVHSNKYVTASSDLKIVKPNAVFGIFTPFYRNSSKLAWVIKFNKFDDGTNIGLQLPESFIVKIDAENGNIIGGKVLG